MTRGLSEFGRDDLGAPAGGGDPWMEAMRRGDFASAWRISDDALQQRRGQHCWDWPRHLQYVWDGSSLVGQRVLIRCYHGLGDTVQFVRFVPLVARIAREVTLWVQPALIPLLERSGARFGRLLPLHNGTPEVTYDVDLELMELPHVLRTTLATLPREIPYLFAASTRLGDCHTLYDNPEPPAASSDFPARKPGRYARIGKTLAVGVAWRSGDWDERRSIAPGLMAELAGVPGVRVCWLQDSENARRFPLPAGEPWCPTPVNALASAITSLDLVITVDSLPAHLAGALGRPTWTLLPARADWRWMDDRDDSPWYPTMRLFRQERAGDWATVIAQVRRELEALASGTPLVRGA